MRAVFWGNGTLLIRCAAEYLQAGGEICAIVSEDARIAEWAHGHGVKTLSAEQARELGDASFEYLFSVVNLTVLPADILSRAKIAAINFHDGPLPEYVGLNTPSWALIEGRDCHAVCWHEMTEVVDAGRVLKTRQFDIAPTDTAFSLNLRCYDLGLETYRELLADIVAGEVEGFIPTGERRVYAAAKRPAALGVLDFTLAAADLCRLVRGLDFGNYANPLALAKIWTGDRLAVVRELAIGAPTTTAPGSVLRSDSGSLTVAAADREVTLSALTDLSGQPVSTEAMGLSVSQVLPPPPTIDADALRAIGRAEPGWEAGLRACNPAMPPYPRSHSPGRSLLSEALPRAAEDLLLAAYLAWVGGLTSLRQLSVAIRHGAAHPALSDLRPFSITLDPRETADALQGRVRSALADVRGAAPMASDLSLRLDAGTRERVIETFRVVIAEGEDDADALGDADLGLALDPPRLLAREGCFDAAVLQRMKAKFSEFLGVFAAEPDRAVGEIALAAECFAGSTDEPFRRDLRVQEAIEEQARQNPSAPALEVGSVSLTRAELNQAAEDLAKALAQRGARPGTIIGVCLDRGVDLVVAMLAILKTGAAYLPLDPDYPTERIGFMVQDADVLLIVASPATAARQGLDPARVVLPDVRGNAPLSTAGTPEDLAYLIYTSGSTGVPKGVMVPHKTVMNFFAGMDALVPLSQDSRVLAVTSVSFDIAVLEIFWTLARGATLVLQSGGKAARPDFSLFYFAAEVSGRGPDGYRLLMEGAKFADENGFEAIWTPERHFHAFGGLYPNPAITAAALSGITRNVKLRAGSVVAPLHHAVRLAEDWALIDNLSNGRAGIALAAGWQPNDFVLRPENFADRKKMVTDTVGILRKLWRGERAEFPGHDDLPVGIEVFPKPLQSDLPLWLTVAGNPETFAEAARLGCGILTHLLGQSFEEMGEKIRAYRKAWREAGHAGEGHVVVMLHSFVGETEDGVRKLVREPMKSYLQTSVELIKQASWSFPTFAQRAEAKGMSPSEMFEEEDLSAEDLDQLLEHAFERYYRTSGLFGTPDTAKDIVRKVAEAGADEIGCLIDFGVDTDVVLANLPNIKALMDGLGQDGGVAVKASVAEEIVAKRITHLQCTPSMASYLAADQHGEAALQHLEVLMVGGEAFPPELARSLRQSMTGVLLNMYGPTETTIWSSVARLDEVGKTVPLGLPICNTLLSVRSPDGRALPDLVEGELWIGGEGVTQGYWRRPELTAERFVNLPQGRFYRTGDQVRTAPDGTLHFLGRLDDQVKLRGHRIELGEIEAALAAQPFVQQAVVRAVRYGEEDSRLIGYVSGAADSLDPAKLRQALEKQLPSIMVPSAIMVIERMPQTPNGKIDRNALPAYTAAAAPRDIVEVVDETQAAIARIWRDALGLSQVSIDDNFFDLGGHSLLVVQVQRRMREHLQKAITITDVFRFPTIRALSAHVSGTRDKAATAADRGAARAAHRRRMRTMDIGFRRPDEPVASAGQSYE